MRNFVRNSSRLQFPVKSSKNVVERDLQSNIFLNSEKLLPSTLKASLDFALKKILSSAIMILCCYADA